MADKARHAFGTLEKIDEALSAGTIDAYDILFVKDAEGKPYVGWIDKDGNKVVVDDSAELAELDGKIAAKADVEEVTKLENQLATKVDAEEVDEKLEAALGEYLAKKYEISHKPEGTLVNYRDKEIRIMIPASTQFELQNSGEGSDANAYYIGFRSYAPDTAVSFKEDTQKTITDDTMYYFEGNDFAGIDENGRKYSIVWLNVAKYDGSTWTYYGASSTTEHYIGWYYSVQWYDANGKVIASDCIRINLSNEQCHSSIEPYYVGNIMTEVETKINTKIEEKLSEVESSYEIVEF